MNTLIGYDLVPEPKILVSALRACRRLNDMASAIRILEAVKVSANPFIASLSICHNLLTEFLSLSWEVQLLADPEPVLEGERHNKWVETN